MLSLLKAVSLVGFTSPVRDILSSTSQAEQMKLLSRAEDRNNSDNESLLETGDLHQPAIPVHDISLYLFFIFYFSRDGIPYYILNALLKAWVCTIRKSP